MTPPITAPTRRALRNSTSDASPERTDERGLKIESGGLLHSPSARKLPRVEGAL